MRAVCTAVHMKPEKTNAQRLGVLEHQLACLQLIGRFPSASTNHRNLQSEIKALKTRIHLLRNNTKAAEG